MSEISLKPAIVPSVLVDDAVKLVTKTWFVTAAVGHWIFLAYILIVFYPPIAQYGLEGLKDSHLPEGFRLDDTLGNLFAVSHVLLAAIIIGGGPLQFIPAIRRRFPKFHRRLGRSYLITAVISSIIGLYMVWTRGDIGNVVTRLGISGDALLIIAFAIFTVRHAVARQLDEHRRWAMRLFLVCGAVWFFRVALMAWAMIMGGIGIEWESFTGPFLNVLGFAQYLLPLLMLEWYFYCQRQASTGVKMAFVLTLGVLTIYMAIGIFAASIILWLPRM